jgi:uncharacterized protein
MMRMETEGFTPLRGIVGGALIGLTAAVLLLFNGNVFGCSGIASSVLTKPSSVLSPENAWKVVFLAAFFLSSSILSSWWADAATDPRLYSDPTVPIPSCAADLIGGFLVSFGASLGSGCTTGHGVCGMARLSKRSFVAVGTFMSSAVVTAVVTSSLNRQMIDSNGTVNPFKLSSMGPVFDPPALPWMGWLLSALFVMAAVVCLPRGRQSEGELSPLVPGPTSDASRFLSRSQAKLLPAVVAGALFSAGLAISGMDLQSKNLAFLDLAKISSGRWDPTLVLVMGSAVVVSFVSYQFVPGFGIVSGVKQLECPFVGTCFDVPNRTAIDMKLIVGAVCFGLGWGLTGLCPGPAWLQAAAGNKAVIFLYVPTYLLGIVAADRLGQSLDAEPATTGSTGALPK